MDIENQVRLRIFALRPVNAVELAGTAEFILMRFERSVKTILRKSSIQVVVTVTAVESHGFRVRKHKRNIHAGATRAVALGAFHPLLDEADTRAFVPVRTAGHDNVAN